MHLDAKSYRAHQYDIFPTIKAVPIDRPVMEFRNLKPSQVRRTPDDKFIIFKNTLRQGVHLDTYRVEETRHLTKMLGGNSATTQWKDLPLGLALFNGPVPFLVLAEVDEEAQDIRVWMSLTPIEMMTLRPGTVRAKGHTVITGLGLAHQLIDVSWRPDVTKITLVENNQHIIDLVLPEARRHMRPDVEFDLILGDANKVVPKLTADVALLDHYPEYGGNRKLSNGILRNTKNIKDIWIWGAD